MPSTPGTETPLLSLALEKARAGERLEREEGLALLRGADFATLGELASLMRQQLHPEGWVTFVVDRNINHTNVCVTDCNFCGFYRHPNNPDAYVLSKEILFRKIEELLSMGGTQVLMQGGHNPALRIEYYENLFSSIKGRYPITLHALSPSEVDYIARISRLTIRETLARLKAAGLDTIPGGGAEILADRVRMILSPKKLSAKGWLEVMRQAHLLGIPTSATMMFGSVETPAEVVDHLVNLRDLQDETSGFLAFIPWPYQPVDGGVSGQGVTGVEYLKMVSFCRLMLDNIANIQASWVTQGPKLGQVALCFGVNDMGGTMMEENVVAAAGTRYQVGRDEILRLIRDAGYVPAQRSTRYEILRVFD